MDNEKIVEIYNNLSDSLKDKRYLDLIWFKCIKINAFFDNYLKSYFFQKGIQEGYYPLNNFTKGNTWNIKILENWNSYKEELNKVLPHNSPRPKEFMLDLCWLSKDGYTMPLCMELEQKIKIEEIIFDFKKLFFINSNLKIMVFFDSSAVQPLLKILSEMTKSNIEETFLLISLDKNISINFNDIQRSLIPNERFYRITGCIYTAKQEVKTLDSKNFSICIDSQNCVEKINTNF